MINREHEELAHNVTGTDIISDNAIVDIKLAINKPGLLKKNVTYRKFRAIDITQLHSNILESVVTPHTQS